MKNPIMISEVSKILERSNSAVRYYVAEGKLRALRTNRGVRLFERREVEKFAEQLRAKEQVKAEHSPE